MKIKTSLNYKPGKHSFEQCSGKSLTVPGESMTIKELMQRHMQGTLPSNINRQGEYFEGGFDDPDYEKVLQSDLTESIAEAEGLMKRIQGIQNELTKKDEPKEAPKTEEPATTLKEPPKESPKKE